MPVAPCFEMPKQPRQKIVNLPMLFKKKAARVKGQPFFMLFGEP